MNTKDYERMGYERKYAIEGRPRGYADIIYVKVLRGLHPQAPDTRFGASLAMRKSLWTPSLLECRRGDVACRVRASDLATQQRTIGSPAIAHVTVQKRRHTDVLRVLLHRTCPNPTRTAMEP